MKKTMVVGFALACAWPAMAVLIDDEIPAAAITVVASDEYSKGQAVRHLVDGSGLANGRHDNEGSAQTMWHGVQKPAARPPANGLAPSPAWVRFDFAQPQKFDAIRIWNHNQANLTDRGFRKTRIYGSADGAAWFPLVAPEIIELPRAAGTAGSEAITVANAVASKLIKSVIIAAEAKDGNYGSDYFGVSEVRFTIHREVAEVDLPVPTAMTCVAQPYGCRGADGAPAREIVVTLQGAKLYGEVSFDIQSDGRGETIRLPASPQGADRFELLMPRGDAITKEATAKIAMRSGRAALEQTIKVPASRPWEVYILIHSHVDIGYTDIQPVIAKRQAQNLVRSLELVRETKDFPEGARFKWNCEVGWGIDQFLATATPEQKAEFEKDVRNGDIGIDAMYGDLLTGLCRGEELIRQATFSTAIGRACGATVDSMMISDVPGLTWGIVPALAQAGVKYISCGPNAGRGMEGDRIGYVREQWEHNPFWWVSPSGKQRALYWGAQGGYSIGHHFGPITDALPFLLKRLESVGYPYDIVQLRWTKGDNGPPDETVMRLVRDWNEKHAWPKLIIATTHEAFTAFEKRYAQKLPVYRGDLTPYWEDGAASSARETGINRQTSDRLVQAEALWAMFDPKNYPAAQFDEAWKNAALYDEHTWGAHNSIWAPDSDFVKTQWKYKQGFALDAETQSKKVLAAAIESRGATTGQVLSVDVFNTASWPRSDVAFVPEEMNVHGGFGLRDDAGNPVPSQLLSDGRLAFLARDIPPFGSRRYRLAACETPPESKRASGSSLANSMFSVKLDEKTGDIVSIRRAGSATEYATTRNGAGVNSYTYLLGGNVKNAQPSGPAKISVKENGPLVASLLVESDAPGCKKLSREVRLVEGVDRIECIDVLDKLRVRDVEGVHLGFPFNVPDCVVRMNSPLAVCEPEKDQLPGACKNWYSIERWTDIANAQAGVTWATLEAPLMEMGGLTANLRRSQPNPRAYLKTNAPSPVLYSWVMNNHWHTNYRADQEGPTTFRFAIRPHGAYDPIAAAHFGVEATTPLIVAPAAGSAPAGSFVSIDTSAIQIASLKPSRDGKGFIVRLQNLTDRDAEAKLTWRDGAKSMCISDALEAIGEKISGAIAVTAHDIVTVRAE